MPTATITTHTTSKATSAVSIPLKSATFMAGASGSTAATLRSLYPRAATAFLQRDVLLTHSLMTSAFAILPPSSTGHVEDSLTSHRRKWDLLRITFETTSYASPPASEDPESFPSSLRSNQLLSPQSFVAALHTRSLQLFTPVSAPKPSSAFLPAQILVTLGLASLKLGCPDIGRGIVEDWLARRGQAAVADDQDGYAKVLDLYCLQILPRLEEWDYAGDFLQYERELSQPSRDEPDHRIFLCRRFAHEEKYVLLMGELATEGVWRFGLARKTMSGAGRCLRSQMIQSLHALHNQALASRRAPSPVLAQLDTAMSAESSRTVSPAPSMSSESSNSTHTATPTSPRLTSTKAQGKMKERVPSMTNIQSAPSTSSSSQSISSIATSATITPNNVQSILSRRDTERERPTASQRSSFTRSRMKSASPLPRPPRSISLDPPSSAVTRAPSVLTIIRSFLETSLRNLTNSKTATFILLLVVFPILSLVFRLRRRKAITAGSSTAGVADSVRRRLQASALEKKGVVAGVWEEVIRPGLRWSPERKTQLVRELRSCAALCLSPLPDYQCLSFEPTSLDNKIIAVARRGSSAGPIVAFFSTVVLSVPSLEDPSKLLPILHTGLTCIAPDVRRTSLTVVIGAYTFQRMLELHPSGFWFTSLAEVPSSLVSVARYGAHVYPSPSAHQPSAVHLHIARTIDERYRDVLLISPDAVFDERRFVFMGSNPPGSCFRKDSTDERYHHRDKALNDFYRGLLGCNEGNEVLQIGFMSPKSLLAPLHHEPRLQRIGQAIQVDKALTAHVANIGEEGRS
ncbi:hypothetical protein EIP91_010624 [Steccherinum ochraceum]|uniref:Uncharacterized protein n=1 Tax=Steccherinum ochraceum TaxID=92696 RepID=A0A4R0R5P0_9APHY|nr:hypothetical protein EIP91_010624 [Steccherinum ochraceum]